MAHGGTALQLPIATSNGAGKPSTDLPDLRLLRALIVSEAPTKQQGHWYYGELPKSNSHGHTWPKHHLPGAYSGPK